MSGDLKTYSFDFNQLDDAALKNALLDPSAYLKPLEGNLVVPTALSEATKARIESALSVEGLTQEDIKKRLDIAALIKVTKIVVEI